MVTIQEIEARESDLNDLETQARKRIRKKIPQRRFGAGVTKKEQEDVVQQRKEAGIVLSQISQQRKELNTIKKEIRQREEAKRKAEAFERGRKTAINDGSVFSLQTNEERAGYRFGKSQLSGFKSRQENLRRIKQLKEQGLTPITENGRIVGFEDTTRGISLPVNEIEGFLQDNPKEITRYGKAGIVSVTPTPRELALNQSLKKNERNIQPYTPLDIMTPHRPQTRLQTQLKNITTRPINIIGNIYTGYKGAETSTSQKIPTFSRLTGRLGKPSSNFESFIRGAYTGVQEKPITAGLFFAGGYISKPVLSSSGKILSKFTTDITRKRIGTSLGVGLVGVYGYKTYERIKLADNRFYEAGKITSTELLPFYAGDKARSSLQGFIRTFGRKEIPLKSITLPDVIKGKTRFVESKSYGYRGPTGIKKRIFDINIFRKSPYSYHATPESFTAKSIITQKGTSEFSGLYVAPSSSVYFLKADRPKGISNSLKSFSFNILDGSQQKPAIFRFKKGNVQYSTKLGEGKAFVTGVKPEIEAVIPEGTTLYRVNKKYFTKYKGQRIPIDEFTTNKLPKSTGFSTGAIRNYYSSSGIGSSTRSIRTPISYSSYLKSSSTPKSSLRYSPSSKRSFGVSYKGSGVSSNKINISINSYSSSRGSSSIIPPTYSYSLGDLPSLTPIKSPKSSRSYFKYSTRTKGKSNSGVEGFKTFIIRRGKKVYLGSVLPRGRALKSGSLEARRTLGATFGIERAGKSVSQTDINFRPSTKIFRSYRIKQGRRVQLTDTFIQRRGTRLGARSEITEIQKANRRSKR